MQHEAEVEAEVQTSRFRDELFIAAYGTQNPELFEKLHPDLMGLDDESGIEWEIPESLDELEEMMDELRTTGWNG